MSDCYGTYNTPVHIHVCVCSQANDTLPTRMKHHSMFGQTGVQCFSSFGGRSISYFPHTIFVSLSHYTTVCSFDHSPLPFLLLSSFNHSFPSPPGPSPSSSPLPPPPAPVGVWVEVPSTDSDSNTITLHGPQEKLGAALTQVYEKVCTNKQTCIITYCIYMYGRWLYWW